MQSPHTPPAACTALPAVTTRVQRNKNMAKLQAGYLFPEVRPGVLVAGTEPRAHAAALLGKAGCGGSLLSGCMHAVPYANRRPWLPSLFKHKIARRRKAHQEKHPDAKIISLGERLCMWG